LKGKEDDRESKRAYNKIWVSDITYTPTDEGWLYLAVHKDLTTPFNGNKKEGSLKGVLSIILIEGAGIRSYECQGLLNQLTMISLMIRKGNCYDNAPNPRFLCHFHKSVYVVSSNSIATSFRAIISPASGFSTM
jgi:transposase InsO family protein